MFPLRTLAPTFHFCSEKMEFKAETKRLLDIVAKLLYTDNEVFIRELLSNASDALEKQRFASLSSEDLMVSMELLPEKRQIVIQDNGVGISKEDLVENLGSKEFIKKMESEGSKRAFARPSSLQTTWR